jgi:hypothetical protein
MRILPERGEGLVWYTDGSTTNEEIDVGVCNSSSQTQLSPQDLKQQPIRKKKHTIRSDDFLWI